MCLNCLCKAAACLILGLDVSRANENPGARVKTQDNWPEFMPVSLRACILMLGEFFRSWWPSS